MIKQRLLLMVVACIALGGAVLWDNYKPEPPTENGSVTTETSSDSSEIVGKMRTTATEPALHQPESEKLLVGNPLASFDKATLTNWVERPLFAPSRRRPPVQAGANAGASPPPAPDYELLGVVLDNKRAIALLRSKDDDVHIRVQTGDMINGWRISSVDWDSITLEREGEPPQTVRLSGKDCATEKCP